MLAGMPALPALQAGRRRVAALLGLTEIHGRLHQLERRVESLETQLHESREEAWERSRTRWRAARPDRHLTWDVELTGDAFVDRAEHHGVFGERKHLVEIGPGYGRLLGTVLERDLPFVSYTGVDLSEENVRHLRERFPDGRVSFVLADVEDVRFDHPVDAVLASLTFKHLFPSFENALANLAAQLAPAGIVLFDLIEGSRRFFEGDGVTYIREYERAEVETMIAAYGLALVGFEEVRHHPTLARLLVVARKPA